MKLRTIKQPASGFTLVEMVVVMGIIAVLGGTAMYFMKDFVGGSKIQSARNSMTSFGSALDSYKMLGRHGYPTTAQGLEALKVKPTAAPVPADHSPVFTKGIPKDPWGNDFVYKNEGDKYEIISKGPDGELATDDDLSSNDA